MTPKLWPPPFATSKPSCVCAQSATTSPTSIPASTAAVRPAIKSWSAWSRNRPTLPRSKRRGTFNGVYHVLHGSISPLHGVGPEQLRIANLLTAACPGRNRRSHPGHQSHGRRRSHRHLPSPATEAAGAARDPDRDGNSGRQRHRIHRRSHHAESHGRPAGNVGLFRALLRSSQAPVLSL
jgi:hypothetical protein